MPWHDFVGVDSDQGEGFCLGIFDSDVRAHLECRSVLSLDCKACSGVILSRLLLLLSSPLVC